MLTVNNFLVNPHPGASHIAARKYIIQALEAETMKMMQAQTIKLMACNRQTIERLEVHFFIYSKTTPNLYYDSIIHFEDITNERSPNSVDYGVDPAKSPIKVFSNSPDFVFTYAYVYNKQNYLINKWKTKLGSQAINNPPVIKNPNQDKGMPLSLFAPLMFLQKVGFYGNYNFMKFINGKIIQPQSFKQIMDKTKFQKSIHSRTKR